MPTHLGHRVLPCLFVSDMRRSLDFYLQVLGCTQTGYYPIESEPTRTEVRRDDVAIIRLEQMHPFPQTQIDAHLSQYENASVYWVQEEPFNMGGWTFLLRMYKGVKPLQVIAREPSASPSTGFSKIHTKEQAEIINRAFE